VAATLEQYIQQVAQSGLMSADDITALMASLSGTRQPHDAESLARELVKQKKLTTFQAQEIYAGRGKRLVLGNYVVLDKLGQGGMGMVLKAEHRRMKRPVALKVLSPAVTKTPEALRRFQREVEAAAKLRHTNIVAADDADEAAGIHFLVMEYVEGSDLSALVKKHGALPLDKALHCIIQAARGLEYAHARGIVHRDIKPANLLLEQSGTVKILDMGLARLQTGGPEQDELTGSGQIMGTVDYMAPEQAMSTKNVDTRADIYSLGITLWYLLSAHPMYDGETAIAKLMAHQSNPIPSLVDYCPIVTPQLQAAFEKMVAKRPADRYQTMTEVIAALEPYRGLGAAAVTISSHPSEDPQLAQLLRSGGHTGSSGAALAAKGSTPKHAKSAAGEATIDSGLRKADTDPQTQSLLPIPLSAAVQRAKTTPTYSSRKRQPTRLIAAGVAAIIVLGAALIWAIVSRGPNEPSAEPGAEKTAKTAGPAAEIKVPEGGSARVSSETKLAQTPAKPAPAQPQPAPPQSPSTANEVPVAVAPPELAAGARWKVVDAQPIVKANMGVPAIHHPQVSADGLGLVFASAADVTSNLMLSTRGSPTAPWNKAAALARIDSGVQEGYGTIDQDQLNLVFFSKREGDHLWTSSRFQPDQPFPAPTKLGLSVNKANIRSWYPNLSADGRWLTFVQESFFGANKAFIGERNGPGKSVPVVRELGPEIDALGYCRGAAVTDDGLTIVVDMGQAEAGQPSSLWLATRTLDTAPFTQPELLGEFPPSADGNILNPTLSGDGHTLWFIQQGAVVRCQPD